MKLQEYIQSALTEAFIPAFLDVINESDGHNVAKGSETHFKVVLVSSVFDGLSSVKRHQSVYKVLAQALDGGVHALALHTYTPDEWSERAAAPSSPNCMGGAK